LRICFFNRSYAPDSGATGQLLAELAQELVATHGHAVSVVAGPLSEVSDFASSVAVRRVWGTTFSPNGLLPRIVNYLTYVGSAFLVSLKRERFDVVVALTDPPIIGLIAWLAARRTGARFVFICQDVFPEVASLVRHGTIRPIQLALHWISSFIIHQSDAVITIGETMKKRLVERRRADARKIHVIHNWASREQFFGAEKSNPFSLAHGLAETFVVMHSGNVGLSQNLDMLLEVADRLKTHGDIRFVVIGDGVRQVELRRSAADRNLSNVLFLPYQPKSELRNSYALADVFVVSLKQGLSGFIVPSKVYGILASGRPYIAAVDEDSEAAEMTRQYNCGFWVPPGDVDGVTKRILELYRDKELRRMLGENGRAASAHYNLPPQAAAYDAVFREVLRKPEPVSLPKRSFDIALSGIGLFVSSPMWAVIALAIKLDDAGPIFYMQDRVGRGGRLFKAFKFRSMIPNADATFGPLQAQASDVRITRVGRFLRATAMDELPQLWNIFRGDMSFVGPRALRQGEVEIHYAGSSDVEACPGFAERHRVQPGLTGLAQVYARRDLPRRQKFKLDLLYVKRRSFWLDVKLVVISFWISFRGKWEHSGKKF
jgi:colanic acid biosynthesis glycosyl transferase WcaI